MTAFDDMTQLALAKSSAVVSGATEPLVLHGTHDQYTVVDDSGSLVIKDSVGGRDGTQDVAGASQIVFADGTGLFDPSGTAEDVSRLYGAAFGRGPDVAGLEFWTGQVDDSHLSLSQAADDFVTSPEFIQDYGTLSDNDFVQALYQNVLNRPGEAGGVQFWDSVLAAGGSRGAVLNSFSQSPENRADTLGTAGDTNDSEAYRLYGAALGRAPDQDGQTYWSTALASGETPTQVAQGFVNSAEFQAGIEGLSPSDFVSSLYQNTLNRPADTAGLAYWTSALAQGASQASIIVAFADSPENRAQTANATHANWVFIPT